MWDCDRERKSKIEEWDILPILFYKHKRKRGRKKEIVWDKGKRTNHSSISFLHWKTREKERDNLTNRDRRLNHSSISFLHRKRAREKKIVWLIEIEDWIIFPFIFYKEKERGIIWLTKIVDRIILPFIFYRERERGWNNLINKDKESVIFVMERELARFLNCVEQERKK